MTLPEGGSDHGTHTNPDGVIKVAPGIWIDAATSIGSDNNIGDDIKATILTALNELIDALGALSYVQSAVKLCGSLLDLFNNMELSLGCINVNLRVVTSGLIAAANAFASVDSSLANTFTSLESQMGYFTTDALISPSLLPTYTPLQQGTISMSVGDAKAFHDMMHWGSDVAHGGTNVYHGAENLAHSIGVPAGVAGGLGMLAAGAYYVFVGGAAAAAAG